MSFPQTPTTSAFDFTSTIKPNQVLSTYSPDCIFCSSKTTTPLMQDGSFRQCLKCRRNFKPTLLQANSQENLSQPVSYKTPIFQTMRPNYTINPKNQNQN